LADVLHFLLAPDRASGRSVRRALASGGARWGTVVGTFGELVDQACKAYLLKPVVVDKSNWAKVLIDSGYYKRSQFD
jgi:ABC-type xylose transport system substrate-binding protein